jgi:hypothetical protein
MGSAMGYGFQGKGHIEPRSDVPLEPWVADGPTGHSAHPAKRSPRPLRHRVPDVEYRLELEAERREHRAQALEVGRLVGLQNRVAAEFADSHQEMVDLQAGRHVPLLEQPLAVGLNVEVTG